MWYVFKRKLRKACPDLGTQHSSLSVSKRKQTSYSSSQACQMLSLSPLSLSRSLSLSLSPLSLSIYSICLFSNSLVLLLVCCQLQSHLVWWCLAGPVQHLKRRLLDWIFDSLFSISSQDTRIHQQNISTSGICPLMEMHCFQSSKRKSTTIEHTKLENYLDVYFSQSGFHILLSLPSGRRAWHCRLLPMPHDGRMLAKAHEILRCHRGWIWSLQRKGNQKPEYGCPYQSAAGSCCPKHGSPPEHRLSPEVTQSHLHLVQFLQWTCWSWPHTWSSEVRWSEKCFTGICLLLFTI